MSGFVSFISSGPGDPELLTLKAARLLSQADVILFDDLSAGPILSHCRAEADLIAVGKRAGRLSPKQDQVSRLLVDHALTGAKVVRLKSGDSGIFGRLEEEISALNAAGVAAGKEVAMTSLALITLKRERKLTAELQDLDLPVEVNDVTALAHVPEGRPFWVGPLVNVYNEGTMRWLIRRGARRVCLPPELALASIAVLARVAGDHGVPVEVWGHGRLPLAISGRCYHARLHDRSKDSCQFVCEQDPDGREVETLDCQPFLAVNGVQTLSQSTASMAVA
jgi:collagenase-like PrtC family protease